MSDPETRPTSASRVLDGRFELTALVGSGGMAEVWRARDNRLGRDVAVKILSGPSAREESMRRRIEREARALAAINHQNIISVYDYGEGEGPAGDVQPYIVMELVNGPDLHQYLQANGPLAVDEVRGVMRALLSAVDAAHTAGVVHGDLKPANVIFGADGPKVGDFGVARILAAETGNTTVAATPSFAAPEVLRGSRPGPASDIYSAACMAFEMLTGRPPYEGANSWEVAARHLEDPVPSVRDVNPDVPYDFAEVLRRAMAKNARRRFDSPAAFAEALSGTTTAETVAVPPLRTGTAAVDEGTEVLADRPDLVGAAVLGPFAGLGRRAVARAREVRSRLGRAPFLLIVTLLVLLPLLVALMLRDPGPEFREVPDVREMSSAAAGAQLRTAGFRVDVSFRAVTSGEPDVVLETIPGSGAQAEVGSEIHVIASALVRTPEPVTEERDIGNDQKDEKDDDKDEGEEGNGRGNGTGGRDN